MELEERLTRLEQAHRDLSAQHLALMTVFRSVAPIIKRSGDVRTSLLVAYDTTNKMMEEQGFDADYQAEVRCWMDVLAESFAAEDKSLLRKSERGDGL